MASPETPHDAADAAPARSPSSRRASEARLLRRILEGDPLLCPRCQVEMVVVPVPTASAVVDRIRRHRDQGRGHDPFAERVPPGFAAFDPRETTH